LIILLPALLYRAGALPSAPPHAEASVPMVSAATFAPMSAFDPKRTLADGP